MRRRPLSNGRLTAIPTARPQNLQLLKRTFRLQSTVLKILPTHILLQKTSISELRIGITNWLFPSPHLRSTKPLIKMQVTLTCRANQMPKCRTDQILLREDQWLGLQQKCRSSIFFMSTLFISGFPRCGIIVEPEGLSMEEIIRQKAYSTLRWLNEFHLRLIKHRSPVGNPGLPLRSRILCRSFCPRLSSMIAPTGLSSLLTLIKCWLPLVVIILTGTFGL